MKQIQIGRHIALRKIERKVYFLRQFHYFLHNIIAIRQINKYKTKLIELKERQLKDRLL